VAYFDARYNVALQQQQLVKGPVLFDQRLDKPRVLAPNDLWRSIALLRGRGMRLARAGQVRYSYG